MSDPMQFLAEKLAAQQVLFAVTRRASDALPVFSSWLLGGLGAAFTLVLANLENVSRFIEVTHVRFGIVLFLVSLGVAVLATYVATIVKAGLAAQEDGDVLGRKIADAGTSFDIVQFMSEYERGLLPPIRWIAHSAMNKAKAGDIAAGARMIAKLSQIHALLVATQSLLALAAIGGLAFGLKMQ